MLAAIYARKSTEQSGVSDEAKSVTRQIEHARAYAARHRWTVAEEHIYVDDGISGAEFVKRPGLARLMNALTPRPPFEVLIMSEESRLGREQIETAYCLKQILDAGVRVRFYLEDRERTLDTALDKIMLGLTTFAAEMEREKARQRTYDALLRKARALQVTGGKVFGYDNVPVSGPDGTRQHVVRSMNPAQAHVVRRIFELYAGGRGLVKIAKLLNAEGVPPPRRDTRGWSPTAIREMLRRELYRGEVVWNRTQKVIRRGSKAQRTRPEAEWLRLEAPELRIVSDQLWHAVQERLQEAADAFPRSRTGGRLRGHAPGFDGDSPYLLTGFAICARCRGAIGGMTQFHGRGPVSCRKRVTFYGCTTHRKRGATICSNEIVLRTEIVDRVVLETLAGILDEGIVREAVAKALERLRAGREQNPARRTELERELAAVAARLGRLASALAEGGPLETLVSEIKGQEDRKKALTAELEHLRSRETLSTLDAERLANDLWARAVDLKALLARRVPQTRQMLRKLLLDRILVDPITAGDRPGYRVSGSLNLGQLLEAVNAEVYQAVTAVLPTATANSETVVAPTGFEPVFTVRHALSKLRRPLARC